MIMKERIRNSALRDRILSPQEAARLIESGMTIAVGGYTSCGYPKAVIHALAERKLQGEDLVLDVVSGANNGFVDTMLAEPGIIRRRAPMIESKTLAGQVNKGLVHYCEQQMNKMPGLLRREAFGHISVAVVEALAVEEDGSLIPTNAIGFLPNLIAMADKVIVELNSTVPEEMEGMHDVYLPDGGPNPIRSAGEHIGRKTVPCPPEKIAAIVFCDEKDEVADLAPVKPAQKAVSDNLLNFLELEMKRQGRTSLPPIQTGFGNLAAEIVSGLGNSTFRDLEFFGGVAQEANIRLLKEGKARTVSCGSVKMSENVREWIRTDPAVREGLILRNGEVTNSSEVIARLGPITLTSGIEMDIYGNVNSSHISGSRVVNGLGGGANFAENGSLSVMMIVSENKGGAISTIVPMVSHQDISEHDIDVVVTEHGVADLRGLDDVERAEAIIKNCTGLYQEQLMDYLMRAKEKTGGHHPILLDEALSWHIALKEQGTMLKE